MSLEKRCDLFMNLGLGRKHMLVKEGAIEIF